MIKLKTKLGTDVDVDVDDNCVLCQQPIYKTVSCLYIENDDYQHACICSSCIEDDKERLLFLASDDNIAHMRGNSWNFIELICAIINDIVSHCDVSYEE